MSPRALTRMDLITSTVLLCDDPWGPRVREEPEPSAFGPGGLGRLDWYGADECDYE